MKSEHLLRLIHEVNPTERGLRDAEQNRRYALKARLQSLLVRRFPEQIRVLPGESPGVVSLQHLYAGLDACHAVLDELEEDARAWVTYQLDIGDETEIRPPAPTTSSSIPPHDVRTSSEVDASVASLLTAGKGALGEYDFELAAGHFHQALQVSGGAIEPARFLLELWVDHLCANDAALELESRLPKATMADPEIRALLGTAAARTKDLKRAERLTRGLDDARAAEIIALCARGALEAMDLEAAPLWIAQLRSLDSAHPAILESERELQKLRNAERQVAESKLEQLAAQGSAEDAERFAGELLQRHPQSEVAARWLQRRAEERASAAAQHALEHAARAQLGGALREASMTLRSALVPELHPDMKLRLQHQITEIDRLLRAADETQRAADAAARFERVLGTLATRATKDAQTESALDAYFELPTELRARVRELVGRSELEWTEPILVKLGVRRAKHAAHGVLLLFELKPELEQHPTEALLQLQPFVEALEAITQSSRVLARAKRAARQQRQSIATAHLLQAEQELAGANHAQALRLLEAISADDLAPTDAGRRRELLSATHHALQHQQLEAQLDLLCRQGKLFVARGFAARNAERAEGAEQTAWRVRRDELSAQISRTWCWETGTAELWESWPYALRASYYLQSPEPWVEPGGTTALLTIAAGRWLLILRYHLETLEVKGWVRMLFPEFNRYVDLARVTEDVAVLVNDRGATLQVNVHDWELLDYAPGMGSKDWRTDECVVSRDGRWVWQAQDRDEDEDWRRRIQVMDLSSHRIVREYDDIEGLFPIVGQHDAEVGVRQQGCVSFHHPKGSPHSALAVELSLTVAVQAPSGNGLVGAYWDDERDNALVLVGPMRQGRIPEEFVLKGSSGESQHQLAVSLDRGVIVVRYYVEQEQWLEAFEERGDYLVSVYRVPISRATLMLSDRRGRRVWLVAAEHGVLCTREIGREPNALLLEPAPQRYLESSSFGLWECSRVRDEATAGVPLVKLDAAHSAWEIAEAARSAGSTQLLPTLNAAEELQHGSDLHAMGALLQLALLWAFPADPNARLRVAEEHASDEEWAAVHRSLCAFDVCELPLDRQRHALHLLAVCSILGRDLTQARAHRQKAASIDGPCDLSLLDQLLQPVDDLLDARAATKVVGPKRADAEPALIALRRALRDARALLAAGDPRTALRAVTLPELFSWADEQLLACAAEVLMELEPRDAVERLRRECILSALLASDPDRAARRPTARIPEAYDAAQLDAIRARAARQFELDTGAASLCPSCTDASQLVVEIITDHPIPADWPPPLGHERLLELHPGLSLGFDRLLDELRGKSTGTPERSYGEADLLSDPRVWRIAETERARLVAEGASELTAIDGLARLGPHLGYLVNHALVRQKSYWVHGELAQRLREPLPSDCVVMPAFGQTCQTFAFTDRDTLEIAAKMLDRHRLRDKAKCPVDSMTAYAWRSGINPALSPLSVRLVFARKRRSLPHLVARELRIDQTSDLDTLVNSHRADRLEAALDPIVASPELPILLRMVLRAVLSVADPNVEVRALDNRPLEEPERRSPSMHAGTTEESGWTREYSGDSLRTMRCSSHSVTDE